MVRTTALKIASGLALAALCGALMPAVVRADQSTAGTPTFYHYSTAITTVYGSQYPIAGHLDIEVFPAGNLRGYYHNAYQKAFIQVVGGKDGNYLWFDIGPSVIDLGIGDANNNSGRLHVIATMNADGNSFRGQVYPMFVADASSVAPMPQSTAPEQYLFAAKQVDKSDEDYPFTTASPSP